MRYKIKYWIYSAIALAAVMMLAFILAVIFIAIMYYLNLFR